MPSSPRSEAEFTGRSRTTPRTSPSTTRLTWPLAFSSTNMSPLPMNAIDTGWLKPEAAVLTARSGSTSSGSCAGADPASVMGATTPSASARSIDRTPRPIVETSSISGTPPCRYGQRCRRRFEAAERAQLPETGMPRTYLRGVLLKRPSVEPTLRSKPILLASIPRKNKNLVLLSEDAHGKPALTSDHGTCTSIRALDAYDWNFCWKVWDALRSCALSGVYCRYALGKSRQHRSLGRWSDGVPVTPLKVEDVAITP
jgi:hypothetical protein